MNSLKKKFVWFILKYFVISIYIFARFGVEFYASARGVVTTYVVVGSSRRTVVLWRRDICTQRKVARPIIGKCMVSCARRKHQSASRERPRARNATQRDTPHGSVILRYRLAIACVRGSGLPVRNRPVRLRGTCMQSCTHGPRADASACRLIYLWTSTRG